MIGEDHTVLVLSLLLSALRIACYVHVRNSSAGYEGGYHLYTLAGCEIIGIIQLI